MKQLFFIVLTILSLFLSAQNNSNQFLPEFLKSPSVKNAEISLYVTDLKTGNTLLSTDPQLCITPASVQKLITSAAVLEILGGDFRFKTIVWANGEISNGVLKGDLIISGGGDPTLGSENFCKEGEKKKFLSDWAHWIKKAGIDSVTGNIVADPNIFSDQDVPGSWLWEDVGNHFGAAASGISVYDNIFEIFFNVPAIEGQTSEVVRINPEIPGLLLKNEVFSSSNKSDNATIFGSPFDSYRVIKGTLPAGSTNYAIKASVPDPAQLLASELKKTLTDSLVIVSGNIEKRKVIDPKEIDPKKIVVLWISPNLMEIVEKMNKESINLYAETMLKQIGLTISGEGSTLAGTTTIKDFWNKNGIDTQNLFMIDGSGLSRQNAVTAKTLVDILVYMKNQSKWFDAYKNSIPLTGIEGTQKYYFLDSFLKGKARAKTGSMSRVRSMAGYMTTQNGKEIAFAIIVNNYNGSSSNMASLIEKWMESLYINL
jgi:D-alanyl-D-alanine carboxypeptidase/D-alanyl-D-alanine-endopeptidase (penicillin-binding protein 4)